MVKQHKSSWIVRLMSSPKLRIINTIVLLSDMHFRSYSLFIYFLPAFVFHPAFYVINLTTSFRTHIIVEGRTKSFICNDGIVASQIDFRVFSTI